MGRDTYYDILGVSATAPPDEIKAKYRKLIQRIHPDLDGPVALFRQVQDAYEVLSDPARRAAYDRSLIAQGGAARTRVVGSRAEGFRTTASTRPQPGRHFEPGGARSTAARPSRGLGWRAPSRNTTQSFTTYLTSHPAGVVAIAGAALLVLGAALGGVGLVVALLGCAVLILASMAALGGRGAKECEAYQRSGMAAVDAMTGRQFEVLLEHFFASKGFRVARLGVRRDLGADLLLHDGDGRTIVQVRRWTGVVHHDAVQQAAVAKAHYGVARALVVTSSNYSQHAVTVANTKGITLWDRATLAAELSTYRAEPVQSGRQRFSADLRAGSLICLGFCAALLVALAVAGTRARNRQRTERRRG